MSFRSSMMLLVLLLVMPWNAAWGQVTADPQTGRITVETPRYRARFEGGLLVHLHNKLRDRVMVDINLNPELPVHHRTALFVADAPKTEPYWIYPATEGTERSAVSTQNVPRGVAVTFKGLMTQNGKDVRRFPDAQLTVTVTVDEGRGDLLVAVAGSSPSTLVVGSSVAYSGLMTRSIDYTTAASGLRRDYDLSVKPIRREGIYEWSNKNMGKRMGMRGQLWPAPVTVQAALDDPKASFSVWAEDDVPRSKYLIEREKTNAYVTYEMPPYDTNRQASSVVWRINVFDGGWTAAAKPFADSLKRRGYADHRASFRNDISLIIFTAGMSKGYFESIANSFPPEVRPRIMIWMPQSWRTLKNTRDPKTHDAYYWDNNFSDEMVELVRYATGAGLRVSGYTNPHYHWGNWQYVIDPDIQQVVKGFSELPIICPVAQEKIDFTGHSLAYTPYREHMLRTYKNIYDHMDMSVYMDTMHQIPLDGRGTAVDGMSNYEGTLRFLRAARALKRDQFIGMEFLTELGVMGHCGDYGLFQDLVWSQGWERAKAERTHPIQSFLFRETSIQVAQRVAPWSYGGPRYYHLTEQISERIGTIATTEWPFQNDPTSKGQLDTPEKRHWWQKIHLFVERGLRPEFPEDWADAVMSYLRAKDGARFKFVETSIGSKLVEELPGGKEKLHYARTWDRPMVAAGHGYLHDWIGVTDKGDYIGLDSMARGYVLFPEPDQSTKQIRVTSLPENLAIIHTDVDSELALVEVAPRDRKHIKPAISGDVERTKDKPPMPISGAIELVTDRPLVRVAAASDPNLKLESLGQSGGYRYRLTGNFWGEVAFIWRQGVYAPFETTDDYLVTIETKPPAEGLVWEPHLQDFDPRWNADISGPRNPRPGSIYSAKLIINATPTGKSTLACFLTHPSTKTSATFQETNNVAISAAGSQELTLAGVRQLNISPVFTRSMIVRMYPSNQLQGRIEALGPIRFVRPTLVVSSIEPMDLGKVKINASAESPARLVSNSQSVTTSAAGKTYTTVLYGTAHINAPNPKAPHVQEIDHVGIVLVGPDAEKFELVGEHATAKGLKLVGLDGEPGLRGGPNFEQESFAVRFKGASSAGQYRAAVRIVTQAANMGVMSKGTEGQPLENLYYVDVPVQATVEK